MATDPGGFADSRAVLIGVSAYEDAEFPPIRAAHNSLQAMRALLSDPALCAWAPERITIISDPHHAADLADRIADLSENITGALLLYYVGHGVLSARGELCLTVTSTHRNRPKISGLPWDILAEVLRACPAKARLAILDCCFAGQAIEALSGDGGPGLADIAHVEGIYTLTATTRNRTAHVPHPDQQETACTSFTGELRDLIRSGIPGGPPLLTLGDIYPVLRQRLHAKGLPTPSQRGTDTVHQFPFTANAAALIDPHARNHRPDGTGLGDTAQEDPEPVRSDRARSTRILTDAERVARRKPRRTVITSAAIAVLLVGVGVGTWLSQDHSPPQHHSPPLTVNTCARTSSAPTVPLKLGSMSVGRPGLNKDYIGATFGPDCQVLATGGNGTEQVWNMVTGHRITALPVVPGGWAFGAAFSPDGKAIAVPASNGTATLWDMATGHLKGTLNSDPNGSTFSAVLSPDGATLFTGGTTKVVDEWDVATQKLMRTIPTPGIGSLALSPGGKVLAVGGADGTQRLWDVASGRKVATLPGHQGNSFALAFSPDGRTLAVGTDSGGVQWWDVASGKLIAQGTGSVTNVAFSPDGKILAAGGHDAIILWDANTHQPITTLSLGSVGVYVSGLAFSRYGGVLAVGYDGALQLWNVAGVSRISQLSVHGPRTTVRSA